MVGWKGVCMVGFSSRHDDYQIFSLPCPPSLILATAHNQGALIVSSPSTNICLRGWWNKGKSSTIVSLVHAHPCKQGITRHRAAASAVSWERYHVCVE